jgi:hypothetical protein
MAGVPSREETVQFGSTTLSMTWITPLLVTMSVFTTLAWLIITLPYLTATLSGLALDRRHLARGDVLRHHRARHHVVGQHGAQLILVLEQGVELVLGDLGERLVGRREHRERARALQGVDQAGGLDGGDEGVEAARRNGGIDDVLLHFGNGRRGSHGDRQTGGQIPDRFRNLHFPILQ